MAEYFCADNIKKKWDSVDVDISFTVEKNTMTTIVGPSGSGKSTVLRIIAGLEKSDNTDMHIFLDNDEITNLPPGKRNMGMVFQQGSLFLHMSIEDNIAYGLRCKGENKKVAREKARAFLERFNLQGFEKRYPETLSGGETQRVALARTLIVQPKLVLFDEPLSALDAPLRKKLASDISQIQKDTGFTGIMVTHDIDEAKEVSDRIILLNSGKIAWQGKATEFDVAFMEK